MTARKHSIQKRRNKMTEILLRTVAIVHHSALGIDEVRTVDMKLERVSRSTATRPARSPNGHTPGAS